MLRRRNHAVIVRIVPLHPRDKRHAHSPSQEWIFSVRLLPTAPARIAKDIQVRRPEIQPMKDQAISVIRRRRLLINHACLGADVDRHFMNFGRVEGRCQPDRLGKLRRSHHRHAVQRLAPPVVPLYSQPRNRACLVHQLARLFFERHPVHQVGRALLGRQIQIQVRRLLRILRTHQTHRPHPQQHSRHRPHSTHRNHLPVNHSR